MRNMRSVGIDLARYVDDGSLRVVADRPTQVGLEHHLSVLHRHIEARHPALVVIDPITDFQALGSRDEIKSMLTRTVDYLKQRTITSVFTSLISERDHDDAAVSSLIDTSLQLGNDVVDGRLMRTVYVRKSRGMAHSERVRGVRLAGDGIHLTNHYSQPADDTREHDV